MLTNPKPLHIGFVFYDFSDSRAIEVLNGIVANLGNDRLSLFPAGPLNSATEAAENNRVKVLEVLKNSHLDGVISLQFWESEAWFKSILLDEIECTAVPLLRNYPSAKGVISHYFQGGYETVQHLIVNHGCRKPYYLIGSAGNSSILEERFAGYKKALKESNIQYSDDMRITMKGSFSTGSLVSGALHQGAEAVRTLFRERNLVPGQDVDSLVVFNDRMAVEVLDALKNIGISVPEDIKVVSFDNTFEGESAEVALTSSGIDWKSLGNEGLNLLRRTIEGQNIKAPVDVSSSFVIRQSCGCQSPVNQLKTVRFKNNDKNHSDLFQKIIDEHMLIKEKLQAAATNNRDSSILRNAAMLLAKCTELKSFADTLNLLLKYLKLSECSIYIVDPASDQKYSRQLHWTNNCSAYKYSEKPLMLSSIINSLGQNPISVCESLDQGEKHLGLLIFTSKDLGFVSFGEFRDLLSSTLYSILLNENLRETQDQLIQKEKFSSLGQLVAGIAHEVNTPLGIGVTASSHLVIETKELKEKFTNGRLSKTEFLSALDNISETSQIIQKNLIRSGDLIRSFKNVSVTNMSDTVCEFSIREHLEDIAFTMTPLLKKRDLTIKVICEEDQKINSNPGILSQIFSNLINNSLKHGYGIDQNGIMTMTVLATSGHEILLTYEDDGIGMDAATLQKIFDPFFTTRPNQGGSGLGMFIVFNMVTHKLNGRINVESKPGQGIKVDICIPQNN